VRKRTRYRPLLEVLLLAFFAGAGAMARADPPETIWGATVRLGRVFERWPGRRAGRGAARRGQGGEPLTELVTAATVRNLFATRQFADVRIDAVAAEGGVAVRIFLFRAYRVYPIRFSGRRGVPAEELRRTLPFFAGSVYSEEEVLDGADAVERRFLAEGFPRASVHPETEFDKKRFDARVTYRIDAGERARVADPILQGTLEPYKAEELLGRAKLKPGDRYREAKALADATRIREFLHEKGRLKAEVELIAAQPTEDGRISPFTASSSAPRWSSRSRAFRKSPCGVRFTPCSRGRSSMKIWSSSTPRGRRRGFRGRGTSARPWTTRSTRGSNA
jgi:hypothetical protein